MDYGTAVTLVLFIGACVAAYVAWKWSREAREPVGLATSIKRTEQFTHAMGSAVHGWTQMRPHVPRRRGARASEPHTPVIGRPSHPLPVQAFQPLHNGNPDKVPAFTSHIAMAGSGTPIESGPTKLRIHHVPRGPKHKPAAGTLAAEAHPTGDPPWIPSYNPFLGPRGGATGAIPAPNRPASPPRIPPAAFTPSAILPNTPAAAVVARGMPRAEQVPVRQVTAAIGTLPRPRGVAGRSKPALHHKEQQIVSHTVKHAKEALLEWSSVRLGQLLGRGAFGAVYAGALTSTPSQGGSTSRPCAVKVLSLPSTEATRAGAPAAAGDDDAALLASEDFLAEAMLHQRLCHPNILAVIGIINPRGSAGSVSASRHGPALVKLRGGSNAVTDHGRPDDVSAIVTELCAGGSLWEQLHASAKPSAETASQWIPDGPLSERVVSYLGAQVASGLAYLHSLSPPVLHRDLKSPNILLTSPQSSATTSANSVASSTIAAASASSSAQYCHQDQYRHAGVIEAALQPGHKEMMPECRLVLADFGLARAKARHVGSATMTAGLGTLQWTAPEVLTGERYSEKADVYGLAIVLWELLCRGHVPWSEKAPGAIAVAVSTGHRPALPGKYSVLEAVIARCWSHKASLRPTADEARLMLIDLAK